MKKKPSNEKTKLSTDWLSVCGGCHISIVDLHKDILEVLKSVEICHSPVLMDVKDYPKADIGLLTGAVRSEHDIEVAKKMREKCDILIALGTCAVYGGISGAGNIHTNTEIFNTVYRDNPTTHNKTGKIPAQGIPRLEENVVPLDSVIDVDMYLPGCPPHPSFIIKALKGETSSINCQSVCALCKREMVEKEYSGLKRFRQGTPDRSTCFLSQGYLCFGSVTLDRCLSPCPNNGMVCTGCAGPTFQVLQEPNRDIRTEIAERISLLTKIENEGSRKKEEVEKEREEIKNEVVKEIEKYSKTHYAYAMSTDMIGKKPTFLIKKWIKG